MVLDALTAVGLVGNVVQFVDFSCKLFSQTRRIYNSSSGVSIDTEDTLTLTHDLQDLCAKLSTASR
jgi:hypothetical protein